jgi:hypothetical protein
LPLDVVVRRGETPSETLLPGLQGAPLRELLEPLQRQRLLSLHRLQRHHDFLSLAVQTVQLPPQDLRLALLVLLAGHIPHVECGAALRGSHATWLSAAAGSALVRLAQDVVQGSTRGGYSRDLQEAEASTGVVGGHGSLNSGNSGRWS